MSSTEPPFRIPPKGQNYDTSSSKKALPGKGKVEKIKETDADKARKRKFDQYYANEPKGKNQTAETAKSKPTPFDLVPEKEKKSKAPLSKAEEKPTASLGKVDKEIKSPPSHTSLPNIAEEKPSDKKAKGLPQSDSFWKETDFPPDQPTPTPKLQEHPKGQEGLSALSQGKDEVTALPKEKEEQKVPSPSLKKGKPSTEMPIAKETPIEKEKAAAEKPTTYREEKLKLSEEKKRGEEKKLKKDQSTTYVPPQTLPSHENQQGEKKDLKAKPTEIEIQNLPPLPASVETISLTATTQATPYLSAETVPLFHQMVGTMYVMQETSGVSQTEIMLNNPQFASSKFYGAVIRIEKYSTAPDSFNITLTGSNEAVQSFQQNIPSLMSAFQNGDFSFRVNRLDAHYTTERPVFRRREEGDRGGGGGDAGGGDLGQGNR